MDDKRYIFFSVYWHVVIDSVERMLTFCNMPQVEEMFHNWFSQLTTLCSTVFPHPFCD